MQIAVNINSLRRINGLQLPLSVQQIISWVVLVITIILNYAIVILAETYKTKIIYLCVFTILYTSHIASHVAALLIDPAEKEVRNRETTVVPEFDRTLHEHVIENGRCHICNIYTSTKKTKHCGLCNKCVYEFDHHCKWLNNCIGERNYFAFIGCVTTTLFLSIITFILCAVNIYLLLAEPYLLSSEAQTFINCNSTETKIHIKFCKSSISFLLVLVVFSICALAMTGVMIHLCGFHIHLHSLGLSTYEYIIQKNNQGKTTKKRTNWHLFNKSKHKDSPGKVETNISKVVKGTDVTENETSETQLHNILSNGELNGSKNTFCSDKNKVHPH